MVNDSWRWARESRQKEEKVGGKNNKERWKEYKRENKWDGGRVAWRRVYRFIGFSSIKKENEFSFWKSAAPVAAAAAAAAAYEPTTTVFPSTEQLRGERKKKKTKNKKKRRENP